jgi:hypothetical protein
MDQDRKKRVILAAKEFWNSPEILKAGLILYEHISIQDRPAWGADILEYAQKRFQHYPEIQAVINFARNPGNLGNGTHEKQEEAHQVFGRVRNRLREQKDLEGLHKFIFYLAENVAKVTYNAYGYAAPFDHDAGWWITPNAKGLVKGLEDPVIDSEIWSILSQEQYLTLDRPVRCNPFCQGCVILLPFEI